MHPTAMAQRVFSCATLFMTHVDDPQGTIWPPLPSDPKYEDWLAIESAVSFRRSVIYTCVVGVLCTTAAWLAYGSFSIGELSFIAAVTLFAGGVIGIFAGGATWSRLDARDRPPTPDLLVRDVDRTDDSLMSQELENRREKESIVRRARRLGAARAPRRSPRVSR
jgi:hypothetical protein